MRLTIFPLAARTTMIPRFVGFTLSTALPFLLLLTDVETPAPRAVTTVFGVVSTVTLDAVATVVPDGVLVGSLASELPP